MVVEELKILIGIPTSGRVEGRTTFSIASLIAYFAGGGCRTRQPAAIGLSLQLQQSSVIHSNREALSSCATYGKPCLPNRHLMEQGALEALQTDCTHILFIDDDMTFEPQAVDLLLGRRQPIVGVNYTFKQLPIDFIAVSLDGSKRVPTTPNSYGLQEVAYIGFGLCLIETRVFRNTQKPWFLPEYVPELDTYTTEDNPFFGRARKAGFPCLVDHDASKMVGHLGQFEYRWDTMIQLAKSWEDKAKCPRTEQSPPVPK